MAAPLIALLLPALFVGFGGLIGWEALRLRREAKAAAQWPTAEATILRSGVSTSVTRDDEDHESEWSSFSVLYRFFVDGREFRSTRLYTGNKVWSGSARAAERSAAKYSVGTTVPVYYNPANPAVAVLEPLNFTASRFHMIAACSFAVPGLLIIALLLTAHVS
jgi:hypothetical protein